MYYKKVRHITCPPFSKKAISGKLEQLATRPVICIRPKHKKATISLMHNFSVEGFINFIQNFSVLFGEN